MSLDLEPLSDFAFLLDDVEPVPPPIPAEPPKRERKQFSQAALTRELAAIVEQFDSPYASQIEHYGVDVETGEISEFGRSYRYTRFFPGHALKRNLATYK